MELKVGERYPQFKIREGASLNNTEAGLQIVITMPDITKQEADTLSQGDLKYSLSSYGDILALVLDYKELSFDIMYNKTQQPELPELSSKDQGYTLTILAADNRTAELKSIRLISLSNRFSKQLANAIYNQDRLTPEETMIKALNIQRNKTIHQIIKDSICSETSRAM